MLYLLTGETISIIIVINLIINILIVWRDKYIMEDSFHRLLLANQANVHKKLLDGLQDTELTIGQPKILEYLLEHNGSNQKEIATSCYIEPASLTVILARMEERNMIERKQKNGNRRSLYVYLTPYGKELANKVEEVFSKIESVAFSGISDLDIKHFMEVFLKIKENLTREID